MDPPLYFGSETDWEQQSARARRSGQRILQRPSLLDEWEPSVHHVDLSKVCGWRRGHHHVLGDSRAMKKNGIHGLSLGDRVDYIAAGENRNLAENTNRTIGSQ
jgi:hypothetical protein